MLRHDTRGMFFGNDTCPRMMLSAWRMFGNGAKTETALFNCEGDFIAPTLNEEQCKDKDTSTLHCSPLKDTLKSFGVNEDDRLTLTQHSDVATENVKRSWIYVSLLCSSSRKMQGMQ